MADFEVVFLENRELIFKCLLRLTKDSSLAEELTQETFFRAYMNFASLKDHQKVTPWLCQIARNTYFAWYKKEKRLLALEETACIGEIASPEEQYLQKELWEMALTRLDALEEPYKEVFMLAVFGQLPLTEISRSFGKSESWARVTFYRAKQKIMEEMR